MEKTTFLHLPLQFFAEDNNAPGSGNAGPAGNGTGNSSGSDDSQNKEPTFDDMLKDKKFQAEFDRRITKAQETALANAKASWEAEAKRKAEEEARIAKMSDDEKARHEREQREKAMADREAAVARRELIVDAGEQLAAKNLPAELVKCLDYSSAEKCKESMDAVEKAFNAAVEKRINEKLRSNPPKKGDAPTAPKERRSREVI
ncbi:MAG: DUF4355 domain-containing protein [Ruminiclostridium sp.]